MRYTILALALALGGCAVPVPPKVPISSTFVEAEHDQYLVDGPNTVSGQGFMRQRGGGTVTCAGSTAALFPSTPYFREATTLVARGQIPDLGGGLGKYSGAVRKTRCDAQGNFVITHVPAGRWIVMTEVKWEVARSRQGGMLSREIQVVDGKPESLLLTDSDLVR